MVSRLLRCNLLHQEQLRVVGCRRSLQSQAAHGAYPSLQIREICLSCTARRCRPGLLLWVVATPPYTPSQPVAAQTLVPQPHGSRYAQGNAVAAVSNWRLSALQSRQYLPVRVLSKAVGPVASLILRAWAKLTGQPI